MEPAGWSAQIDGMWKNFRDAGWVEPVTYRRYDPTTDAAVSAADGVSGVDAVGRGEIKQEREAPGGGLAVVITRRFHLRVSTLEGVPATKRGVIQTAAGAEYVVESAALLAAGTRYECDAVKL